jgi:hypothetical protein
MAAWAAASGCCPCAGLPAPSSGANAESAPTDLGFVQVPDGIVYIPAPKSVNDSARAKIALFFHPPYDQGKLEDLSGDQMICGPFLWSRLKDHALVSLIEGTEIDFEIESAVYEFTGGTFSMEGKLIKGRTSIDVFMRILFEALPIRGSGKVRKLNPSEISLYWSLVPFIIREPVFVVEWDKSRLLVDLTKGMKIGFLEELGAVKDAG